MHCTQMFCIGSHTRLFGHSSEFEQVGTHQPTEMSQLSPVLHCPFAVHPPTHTFHIGEQWRSDGHWASPEQMLQLPGRLPQLGLPDHPPKPLPEPAQPAPKQPPLPEPAWALPALPPSLVAPALSPPAVVPARVPPPPAAPPSPPSRPALPAPPPPPGLEPASPRGGSKLTMSGPQATATTDSSAESAPAWLSLGALGMAGDRVPCSHGRGEAGAERFSMNPAESARLPGGSKCGYYP